LLNDSNDDGDGGLLWQISLPPLLDVGFSDVTLPAISSTDWIFLDGFPSFTFNSHQVLLLRSEADLGMFGRIGAPQKRGPHKRTGKFLQHSNMPVIAGNSNKKTILCGALAS